MQVIYYKKSGLIWVFGLLGLLASFLLSPTTSAQSVTRNPTVSVGVGDTVLVVDGSTSPNAFVTFKDGGNLIGTTTADGSGLFSQTFPAQTPGLHSISVSAEDSIGRVTDSISANVNLIEHFTTSVDLFLPSTITLSDASLVVGDVLTLSGETFPNSSIAINLDDNQIATANSNSSGRWSHNLSTDGLSAGQHSVYVVVTKSGGDTSYPTASRSFALVSTSTTVPLPSTTAPPNLPPAPTITEPADGAIIKNNQLAVRGTGLPGAQIELYNGDIIIGSTFVGENGNWSINITITGEKYNLRARACVLDVCSEFSAPVRITTDFTVSESGLEIELDRYAFRTLVGDPITFRLTILGGLGPYEVEMTWGDGSVEEFKATDSKTQLSHIFSSAGRFNGTVKVIDAVGRSAQVSFSTLAIAPARIIWVTILPIIILSIWLAMLVILALKNFVIFPPKKAAKKTKNT